MASDSRRECFAVQGLHAGVAAAVEQSRGCQRRNQESFSAPIGGLCPQQRPARRTKPNEPERRRTGLNGATRMPTSCQLALASPLSSRAHRRKSLCRVRVLACAVSVWCVCQSPASGVLVVVTDSSLLFGSEAEPQSVEGNRLYSVAWSERLSRRHSPVRSLHRKSPTFGLFLSSVYSACVCARVREDS